MIYDGFKILAFPRISDAYCKKCHDTLIEVSNGFLSSSLYCPKCEAVYALKLIKVPESKLSKKYIEQCRREAAPKKNNNDD